MTLREAQLGKEYIIRGIVTADEELNAFLFSLGCYSGEPITVVARLRSGCGIPCPGILSHCEAEAGQNEREVALEGTAVQCSDPSDLLAADASAGL